MVYRIGDCEDGEYRLTLFFAPSNPIHPDIVPEILVRNRTVTQRWSRISVFPENYRAGDAKDLIWVNGVITQQHKTVMRIQMQKGINELEICFTDGISVFEKMELERF